MNLKLFIATSMALAAFVPAFADFNSTPVGWLYDTETHMSEFGPRKDAGFRCTSAHFTGVSEGAPVFSTTWVQNVGVHERSTIFVYNRTESQILNDYPGKTLLDISRYTINGKQRFAAIYADEPGAWAYLYGQSLAQLSEFATRNNLRITELDVRTVDGGAVYDAVFGAADPLRPTKALKKANFNNINSVPGYHVIDLQPRVAGDWAVLYEKNVAGDQIGYGASSSFASVRDLAGNNGMRMERLVVTTINGAPYYSTVLVANTNTIERRMVDYMLPNTDGNIGAYLKRVDGPILADLQAGRLFHPSSTIKALFSARVINGTPLANMQNRLINVWPNHTKNDHTGETPTPTSLPNVVMPMMLVSNNQMANALMDLYGMPELTDSAQDYGMPDTVIRNKMGTGGPFGNPGNFTTTTLFDLGTLYEGVATASIMNASRRNTFYSWMVNESVSDYLSAAVADERAFTTLTNTQFQQWKSLRTFAAKAGSNTNNGGPVNCYLSIAGSVRLPYNERGTIVYREFVYGAWVNDAVNTNNVSIWSCPGELLREQIRASLKSFETA